MSELPTTNDYRRLFLEDVPLLDVRAPVEFAEGAFPGAENHPLVDDAERHQIGITYKEEEELSREFLAVVASRFTFIKDPIIEDYVTEIGQRILKEVPTQPFRYHFYVIKEDVYNAFATPAGHIFINSGLLEAVKSEEEIAGQSVTTLDYGDSRQHIFSTADTIWVISDPLGEPEKVEEAIERLPQD